MHGNTIQHDERSCCDAAHRPQDVFFSQACPICGRMLRIVVKLLGSRVYCQHCGGGFVAADETLRAASSPPADASRPCEQTVDELLARAEAMLGRSAGRRRISR
jgi:hypothetical protein